ncbi:MAG: hypothetical protein AAFQ94_20475 [Bacteroidota bacterium]
MKKINKQVIYFFVATTLFTSAAFAANHFFQVPDLLFGSLMGIGFGLQITALIKTSKKSVS